MSGLVTSQFPATCTVPCPKGIFRAATHRTRLAGKMRFLAAAPIPHVAGAAGFAQWWPTEWTTEWDAPSIWFNPGSRMTVAATFLSTFAWYICTAGSDQMAIQRYLATRDTRAARRMVNTSLAVNALVIAFLACVGLELFAWFRLHPEMLADRQSISTSADQLLPRFVVIGLPNGISGLVIAALLAAAMSSLSSGINSSCSVIKSNG